MKDITRIHIAKVPYEIELTAKKELEKYIVALEAYASDEELLNDIEIRMTELLLERGVKQGDVITSTDVKTLREQLGEPKDFMTDEATLGVDIELLTAVSGRKLYRNLDTALLGGVLGGIASYFKMNPLWVRLAFIFLILVSFGTFALLYAILWLIIPAARTAAEKLQLTGRPVTLASIRELNEAGMGVNNERRTKIQKRIATMTLGIFGLIGALMVVVTLILVIPLNVMRITHYLGGADIYQLAVLLAAAAGVLLVALLLLITFAAFAQKFNKRIWVSGVIIIVLGLGLFGSAIMTGSIQHDLQVQDIRRNTIDTNILVPNGYASVTSLSVDVPNCVYVVYTADDTATSIKQRGLKGAPKVDVTVKDGTLLLKLTKSDQLNPMVENTISLYGPRLDSITISNGYASYNSVSQPGLKVEAYNAASLHLIGSRIDTLTVKTDGNANLSAEEAAISAVKASMYGQSSIGLGNIKSLDISNPDVCASNGTTKLSVQNILSTFYVHNGIESVVKSVSSPCLDVQFAIDGTIAPQYLN